MTSNKSKFILFFLIFVTLLGCVKDDDLIKQPLVALDNDRCILIVENSTKLEGMSFSRYEYNPETRFVTKIEFWEDSIFKQKLEFVYDINLTEANNEIYLSNSQLIKNKTEYEYDEENRLIASFSYGYNSLDSRFELKRSSTFNYENKDGDTLLIKETDITHQDSTLVKGTIFKFHLYDEKMNRVHQENYYKGFKENEMFREFDDKETPVKYPKNYILKDRNNLVKQSWYLLQSTSTYETITDRSYTYNKFDYPVTENSLSISYVDGVESNSSEKKVKYEYSCN